MLPLNRLTLRQYNKVSTPLISIHVSEHFHLSLIPTKSFPNNHPNIFLYLVCLQITGILKGFLTRILYVFRIFPFRLLVMHIGVPELSTLTLITN
jgi:hypothetical protein